MLQLADSVMLLVPIGLPGSLAGFAPNFSRPTVWIIPRIMNGIVQLVRMGLPRKLHRVFLGLLYELYHDSHMELCYDMYSRPQLAHGLVLLICDGLPQWWNPALPWHAA